MGDFENALLEEKRILVAEDNELNKEIIMEMLKVVGATAKTVGNGKEAVEEFAAAKEGTYDYVILDVQMPVMRGCEAAKTIRSMERADAKQVPIIALTAEEYEEAAEECFESGMNAFLRKPVRLETLLRCIETL